MAFEVEQSNRINDSSIEERQVTSEGIFDACERLFATSEQEQFAIKAGVESPLKLLRSEDAGMERVLFLLEDKNDAASFSYFISKDRFGDVAVGYVEPSLSHLEPSEDEMQKLIELFDSQELPAVNVGDLVAAGSNLSGRISADGARSWLARTVLRRFGVGADNDWRNKQWAVPVTAPYRLSGGPSALEHRGVIFAIDEHFGYHTCEHRHVSYPRVLAIGAAIAGAAGVDLVEKSAEVIDVLQQASPF